MPEERVQKILARAGYGSRRSCEELILAGRVRINGQPAVLGSKADPSTDSIQVDGQRIPHQPAPVYVMLHKPQGVLSDVETHGDSRQTVRDMIPLPGHLFSVGRLDYESEGLIILTNDGDLANQLTHPRYGHEKEYRVLLAGRPDERQLSALRHGIVLEDGHRTAPASVREESGGQAKGVWLRVILREGRKRQIREMGLQIVLLVQRIVRVRMGSLRLGTLKTGDWRYLTPEEIKLLKKK
jgi:23S rRNA pseudouridine2605 synthase